MRHTIQNLVLLGVVFVSPAALPADDPEAPVQVQFASYHVPIFHNEYATLLRILIPGKHSTNYHIHDQDLITVVVEEHPHNSYSQRLGAEQGKPRGAKLGQVDYNPYSVKAVTHKTINPDEIPVHVAGIQLNGVKPFGFDVAARDAAYVLLFDNERARAWRLTLEPGKTAPLITQAGPGVRVVVHGGEIAEVVSGKRDRFILLRVGDIYWQDPGAARAVRNSGDTPVELVEIELK